ncbi:MAG: hypothetical protein HRU19_16255 [Pseudobacteriovorax sp.]|nr:hypothetical protein [Pseudobacteriovorax sp.]
MHQEESYESMLSGGHPNSLGRTLEVVADVEKDLPSHLPLLFACYRSKDTVVRLRTSNAFKRLFRAYPDQFKAYASKFLKKLPTLSQPSADWTLMQLCFEGDEYLSKAQRLKAVEYGKLLIKDSDDWIVQNASIQALSFWALDDAKLRRWLKPKLSKLSQSKRKSVANRAKKALEQLST